MLLEEIETQEEYDDKLYEYRVISKASAEVKEEAILRLKRAFPQFDKDEIVTSEQVLKDISDGQADIPKLEG